MFEDYRVKNFPTPGIEPGPVKWKLTILATRPYGALKKYYNKERPFAYNKFYTPLKYSIG